MKITRVSKPSASVAVPTRAYSYKAGIKSRMKKALGVQMLREDHAIFRSGSGSGLSKARAVDRLGTDVRSQSREIHDVT